VLFQTLEESYKSRLHDLEQVYAEELERARKGWKKDAKKKTMQDMRNMIEDLELIYKENKNGT
jgi:hypothetical protein